MCRNITALRGLEPPATEAEVRAAALQFVRKVTGIASVTSSTEAQVTRAVEAITATVHELFAELPARRTPPTTLPPSRRGHPLPS